MSEGIKYYFGFLAMIVLICSIGEGLDTYYTAQEKQKQLEIKKLELEIKKDSLKNDSKN